MGPAVQSGDWVSFHREHGRDTETDGVSYSNKGTSEVVMRNQFKAWKAYMQPAVAGAAA